MIQSLRAHQEAGGDGSLDRGLLAQIIADRGLSAATVAIDPGPFRGVLPLPLSALRSAGPVLAGDRRWIENV